MATAVLLPGAKDEECEMDAESGHAPGQSARGGADTTAWSCLPPQHAKQQICHDAKTEMRRHAVTLRIFSRVQRNMLYAAVCTSVISHL